MNDILKECNLCPRNCRINRYKQLGACGANEKLKIAYYSLHLWEEPIISGKNGSGTIFFSNCNLKCIYCQNRKISTGGYGKEIDSNKLKEIMLSLQNDNAHNINLVTPTHYVPQILEVLKEIKNKELTIPVVYNTSSYENVSTIDMLDGMVDIYLADFKYFDDNLGVKYSNCKNYFIYASLAIDRMYRQVGNFVIENDLMKRGLIVRILVLPGHVDDAIKIIDYLYAKYGNNIILSIMNQYTPIGCLDFDNLNRKITIEEYNKVIEYALKLGVEFAFIQDGETQNESFIPNFDISII